MVDCIQMCMRDWPWLRQSGGRLFAPLDVESTFCRERGSWAANPAGILPQSRSWQKGAASLSSPERGSQEMRANPSRSSLSVYGTVSIQKFIKCYVVAAGSQIQQWGGVEYWLLCEIICEICIQCDQGAIVHVCYYEPSMHSSSPMSVSIRWRFGIALCIPVAELRVSWTWAITHFLAYLTHNL